VFEIFIIQKVVVNNNRLLDPGGVQHDADSGAHGLGRQVPAELGANGAGVPVGSGHLKQKKNDCVTEFNLLSGTVADPDPFHFQDPDPFPGCPGSGSGSISYFHEHNKIKWKGDLNKEYLFVWVLLDLLTRKIR
jgi:hypothetical protein